LQKNDTQQTDTECCFADCHYVECRGTVNNLQLLKLLEKNELSKLEFSNPVSSIYTEQFNFLVIFLRYDTQHNDIQPNDTQHNDTQHNIKVITTLSMTTFSITALNVVMLNVYVECHLC
jgi:hypothetical protein